MRKADYAALAAIIAKKRADMIRAQAHTNCSKTQLVALAAEQSACDIAEDFARIASVNKTEFLKACGIDP